ncbi:hypothetical protein [Pseudomonas sp. NFACC45]|uniref:hypothetical protein n=1 Tax=Pseudomonas sp. NFACC45 TaxID=1566201 RepID=UPI0008F30751|nr:hypothetical protein [Pseudomonas sp. NFACC45]SFH05584.1 hypothetical protein SAMN03159297_02832 [Pseudomonas sp. NFACC45]
MELNNNEPGVATWSDLKSFKIFSVSGGNQLYRNGYQQLKVKVVVEAEDWLWGSVAISQSELDSIVLVDALTGLALTKDRYRGPTNDWRYTEEANRFRQLPPNGPIKGSVPPGEFVYTKDFYVTTSSDTPIDLQVCITRADGKKFLSSKASELGSLVLVPLAPAVYRSEQYSVRAIPAYYSSQSPDIAKVEAFVLELIIDQQRIDFVTDFYMGSHLQIGSSDNRYSGYYVVGYGAGRAIRTSAYLSWERPDAVGKNLSEKGAVAFVLAFGKKGGPVWVRDHRNSAALEMRDVFGNLHQLRVGITEATLAVWVAR